MITIYKRTAVAAAVAGVVGVVSMPAQALDAEISGHLNRAVMAADDGENSDTFFVDGEPSNTRMRFVGTQEVSPGLEAGIYLEWELVSNNTSDVSIGNSDPAGNSGGNFEINERHFDASLAGDWGKVSLGQGDGAANGAMEVDLSGTSIAAYSSITDVGGSLEFVNSNTGAGTGVTIGNSMSSFDFLSRFDRIRYDTPSFGPVVLSIGTGTVSNGDGTDLAARYSGDLDVGKLAAAVGYSTLAAGGNTTEIIGGSASLLLDNGFNVTVAIGNAEDDANLDADNFYAKLGYITGAHAVSADFGTTSDLAASGVDGEMFGVQYVNKPIGWMELYAAGKVHSLDGGGTNADDISLVMFGTRIKF